MLTKIRDKTTGWIAYVIVTLLAIPFALWGIQSYFTGSSAVVLEVGDKEINLDQFNNEVLNQKRTFEEQGYENVDELDVVKSAISRLASLSLIDNAIENYGYQISDRQVAEELLSVPGFLDDNDKFDQEKYLTYLKSIQTSRLNYEENLRNQIKRGQFNGQAQLTEFILPEEQEDYRNLVNEAREINYLLIDTNHYTKEQSVNDEEIKKEYDENLDNYKSIPEIRLRYSEIKISDMQDDETVNDINEQDIKDYYEENQDQFFEPEMRQVRHILFNPELRTPEEIKERVKEVETAIEEGTDFTQLVERYSDDFLTAEKEGELPPLSEFDIENDTARETIFSMLEGQVSSPLKTDFGTQMFQLVQIVPEVHLSMEEIKEDIREAIKNARVNDKYTTLVEDLTAIEETAQREMFKEFKEYDVASTVTEWLGLFSEESILKYPQVKKVLFDEIIKGNTASSGPLEIVEGFQTIFFFVEDFKKSRQLAFDEVKKDIRSKLLLVKAFRVSEKQTKKWMEELQKDTEDFDKLANDNQWIDKKSLSYIKRSGLRNTPEEIIVDIGFTLPYSKGKLSYGIANIEENLVLIQVSDSKQQQDDDDPLLSFARRESQAILKSLEEEFPINLYRENIPQLKQENE